jgi:hypothetical protein
MDGSTENQPAPAAPAVETVPPTPPEWPGAFGVYKYSKAAVQVNLWAIVIIWVANAVVDGGINGVSRPGGSLASLVLGALATAALSLLYLAGIRRQKVSVEDALSKAVKFWLSMILLEIVIGVSLMVSLILLIVPFFFVLPRVVLAPYFLVDKGLGVVDAFKASWDTTKGHALKVWGIIGATVLMALLMITIIGIPFSIYFLIMYSAAAAVLYEMIKDSAPTPAPAAEAPTEPAPPPAS